MSDVQLLDVYQGALEFITLRASLLSSLNRRVAASDHLERASESIALNIAHANSSWAPAERIKYIGHSNGSALECAACIDVLVAKEMTAVGDVVQHKELLQRIVQMLIKWQVATSSRLHESGSVYQVDSRIRFDHERLDVYQLSLQLIQWIERVSPNLVGSSDLFAKLDKSSTSIVLNIAEGNGRFKVKDRKRFIATAAKSALQTRSLLDIASFSDTPQSPAAKEGHEKLTRITAMLSKWEASLIV